MKSDDAKKPVLTFHDRYATDASFKEQIDSLRKRAVAKRTTQTLTTSLKLTRGQGTKTY